MKKFLCLVASFALCATFAVTTTYAASSVNADEQKILDVLTAGVTVDGKTVNLEAGDINAARNYFTTDGVDVTAAQATTVLAQIDAAKKVIVDNKITNLSTMDKKFQDQIIGYAQVAAKELGLTIVADYTSKTIVVKDAKGSVIFSKEKAVKNTGDNFTSTLALSGAIALLLAGAGIVAVRKGLFARG